MARPNKYWLANERNVQAGKLPRKLLGKVKNNRTGKYGLSITVLWRPHGQPHPSQKSFPTLVLAKKWRDQQNARLTLGDFPDEILPIDLKDAGREFIEGQSTLADATVQDYAEAISFLGRSIGNPEVHTIGRSEIDRFIADRTASCSEATAAKHCRALKRFFNWCIENSFCYRSPLKLATSKPRNNIKATRPRLSDEKFEAVLGACDTEDRYCAVGIAGTTGLDFWSMVCKLTPADVDWEAQQFVVARKKTGDNFMLPIHDDFFAVLRQRAERIPLHGRFFSGLSYQSRETYWWKRICLSAGVEWLRLSDLRKYAERYLDKHLGPMEGSKRMHRDPRVTMENYHQYDPEAPRLISQRVLPGFRTPQLRVTA